MADFVLVHGAWHGAWCWRRLLPLLHAAGHRAFAVTLTGLGERAHLLGASASVQTHLDDVTALLDTEELDAVVLVGHSYAGMVITGVAARRAALLSHLVYLDAVVPRPGECWSTTHAPEVQAARRAAIREHGGRLPPPDPSAYGLAGDDHAWVARRQTPHPGATYDDALAFDAAIVDAVPRTFVDCTRPALATIAVSRQRARADRRCNLVELATGHDPMISAPQALADALCRISTPN